jgi:hypothetical protein
MRGLSSLHGGEGGNYSEKKYIWPNVVLHGFSPQMSGRTNLAIRYFTS